MTARYPVYAEADLTVISDERPPEATVEQVIEALEAHFGITLPHSHHHHHRHPAHHHHDKP
ncbi:hypothetical protein D3C71_1835940 [compost metagenome]